MKINNLIIFGGNRDKENGPVVPLIQSALRKKISVVLFTDNIHLKMRDNQNIGFREKLKNYEEKGLKIKNCKKISVDQIKKFVNEKTLGLSINSKWIFEQEIIDLFKGNMFNYHNTRLPLERGAGAYTWRILSKSNLGGLTIHKMDAKLDTGDIIYKKNFIFPKTCKIAKDFYKYIEKKENKFLEEFIDKAKNNKKFKIKINLNKNSTYWPRLETKKHGFIDWNWTTKDIESFIHAFDDPYPGASTFLDNKRIFLKKCQISNEKTDFHPYQAGIIIRKYNKSILVAANGKGLIIHQILNKNGKDIFSQIKLGHRLHTPTSVLDDAKTYRVK